MNNRNQLIKLIHVGQRELALDEDTYRMLLESETGKTSCSNMSIKELEQVLAAMEGKGFKRIVNGRKNSFKKRLSPKSGKARFGEIDRIRAIWITMAKQGFVRDGSETALDAYVRRITNRGKGEGVDHVNWCNGQQAYVVLETLKNWHRRVMIDGLKARTWPVPMNRTGSAPAGYDFIAPAYQNMLNLDMSYKNYSAQVVVEYLERHTGKSFAWCKKYLDIYCKGWDQDENPKPQR